MAAEPPAVRSLRSGSDGYLARLDRSVSIFISRRLARTPVTPNQITTASFLLGLLGACLIAQARHPLEILGAALLCACCVLDGCDGEVARLKSLCTPAGARYDVACDNISHVAIFAAVAVHLHLVRPEMNWRLPAFAMLSGMLMSMLAVWRLILRKPEAERPAFQRVFERIASRDYAYIIFVLVVFRRLDWFLWGAAVGSHIFWITLGLLSLGENIPRPGSVAPGKESARGMPQAGIEN